MIGLRPSYLSYINWIGANNRAGRRAYSHKVGGSKPPGARKRWTIAERPVIPSETIVGDRRRRRKAKQAKSMI